MHFPEGGWCGKNATCCLLYEGIKKKNYRAPLLSIPTLFLSFFYFLFLLLCHLSFISFMFLSSPSFFLLLLPFALSSFLFQPCWKQAQISQQSVTKAPNLQPRAQKQCTEYTQTIHRIYTESTHNLHRIYIQNLHRIYT